MNGIQIMGTGAAVPSRIMTNFDWAKIVDTNDEWIQSRSGIAQRYFCENESNTDLAIQAAKQALERSEVDKEDIGLVIVATFTPDCATPSMACLVHEALGLPQHAVAFDLNAACSGFLYAMNTAGAILAQGGKPYALVVGSEKISGKINWQDRSSCILFGDGAGAAVIRLNPEEQFVGKWGSVGNKEALYCPYEGEEAYLHMDGQLIFKQAVRMMTEYATETLAAADLKLEDLRYVVCHQANKRIIQSVMRHLDGKEEQFYMNIQKYGNTSAASIPIALNDLWEEKKVAHGEKILCVSFGAGFTFSAMLITF